MQNPTHPDRMSYCEEIRKNECLCVWFKQARRGKTRGGKQAVSAAARQDRQDITKPQPTTQTPCALKEIHRHQM